MLRMLVRATAAGAVAAFAATAAVAEKVPESRLKEFEALMPAAPGGYTRNPALGTYSSDSASSATATYKSADGSKTFSIVVTFSKDNAKQNADIMKNASQQKMFGMEATKIKGRDALARRADNKNKYTALYLVVVGNRIVSATDLTGTADPAVVKTTFESIDFDAIAKK